MKPTPETVPAADVVRAALLGNCDPVALPMLTRMVERERSVARAEGYRAGLEAGIDAANRQKAIYEQMMEGANEEEFAACEESMCACGMVAAAIARLKETP